VCRATKQPWASRPSRSQIGNRVGDSGELRVAVVVEDHERAIRQARTPSLHLVDHHLVLVAAVDEA
jgi:hypothetical protein